MSVKTIFTFAGGVVVGLILGVMLFSGGPGPAPQSPVAVAPSQPAVDTVKMQQDIARLEEIVRQDPGNYDAWVQLGNNRFDVGESRKSIEAYQQALEIDDRSPNVWTDMGIMYRNIGNFDKAVEAFRTAMAKGPNHTHSRYNLGIVYVNDLKDFPLAIEAWEDFLRVESTGPRADEIRQQVQGMKEMLSAREGKTELPPDHPPTGDIPAQPAQPAGDPSTYFPKPSQ